MRRTNLTTIIASAALALSASAAQAQTFTIINHAGARHLARVERAIVDQSRIVSRYWHTPRARFGPDGWKVYLVRATDPMAAQVPAGAAGVHLNTNAPYIVVKAPVTSYALDHEIVETLVDPYGDRYINYELVEPCDPTSREGKLDGVMLADFEKPAFYRIRPAARWLDWLHYDTGRRLHRR